MKYMKMVLRYQLSADTFYRLPCNSVHQQMGLLKKNMKAILAGILPVYSPVWPVYGSSRLFHLDKKIYATLLRSLSRQRSEWESLRSLVESLRSPLPLSSLPESSGNMFGDVICRLCGIRHPIATGLRPSNGNACHGTAKKLWRSERSKVL